MTEITAAGTTITTREYDDFYRLKSYNDGCGNTIRYEYDKAGNLPKLTYPDGSEVNYEYDACNQLVKVSDWAIPARETLYEYDPAGRLVRTTRLKGATVITERTHIYDYAGQLRYIEERGANPNDKPFWLGAYQYDRNGNITEIITSSTNAANWSLPADTLGYDVDNRLDTWNGHQVTHDNDGDMTNGPLPNGSIGNYVYDMHDRLTSAGGVTSAYNPDGLRVQADGATCVIDPNAGLSRVLARTKAGVATKYIWGANGLEYEVTGNEIKTYHADHLGSTVAITDGSGAVIDRWEYSSYGMVSHREGASDTPFQFHGGLGCMTDSNGLVHMRARFYHPGIMRFLNQDPIGFAGGMNWYAFVGNNPLGFVDPWGLCPNNGSGGFGTVLNAFRTTGGALANAYNATYDALADAYNTTAGALKNGLSQGALPNALTKTGDILYEYRGEIWYALRYDLAKNEGVAFKAIFNAGTPFGAMGSQSYTIDPLLNQKYNVSAQAGGGFLIGAGEVFRIYGDSNAAYDWSIGGGAARWIMFGVEVKMQGLTPVYLEGFIGAGYGQSVRITSEQININIIDAKKDAGEPISVKTLPILNR